MQIKRGTIVNDLPTTSLIFVLTAVIFGLFSILLEFAFHIPLKMPGHRALPGSFTLLLFAEAFMPIILVLFAAIVSSILISLKLGSASLIVVWLLTSAFIIAMGKSKFARSALYYIFCGMVFGLLLWLSKPAGFHQTPEIIRASGYILFGTTGGLFAFGLTTRLKRSIN